MQTSRGAMKERNCHRRGKGKETGQVSGMLPWIPEQKKDNSEKTHEI